MYENKCKVKNMFSTPVYYKIPKYYVPQLLCEMYSYSCNELLPLNVFTASKGSNIYILFAITAAGVVPCGGRKKSPRTSSIVQIIFLCRSFEISYDIQSVQNTHI